MRTIKDAHRGPIFSIYTDRLDGKIITGAKEKPSSESSPIKRWDIEMKKSKPVMIESKDSKIVVKSVCRFDVKKLKLSCLSLKIFQLIPI